ncbi:MAG: calcium-binding protein [Hyphomicrobiaceae bacterium]
MGGTYISDTLTDLKKKIIDGDVQVVDDWANDTITVPSNRSASVYIHGGNDIVVGNDNMQRIYDLPADNARPVRNEDGSLSYPAGTGSSGDDYVLAGGGNDTIYAGDGRNTYDGGEDTDTVSYVNATAAVTIDLQTGVGRGFGTDRLISIENAEGSAFNDALYGSSQDNYLFGGAGNDVLDGKGGDDVLEGGDGDDWLVGGAGNDHIDGGDGLDVVSYADATTGTVVNLATAQAFLGNSGEVDSVVNVEAVIGSGFADILTGNSADNILVGLGGADVLTGGAGRDRFVFTEKDLGTSAWHPDVITDFTSGEDVIDLSGLLGSDIVLSGGPPDKDFEFVDAFTGAAGEVTFGFRAASTIVMVDLDGNGDSDFTIRLAGHHDLTANDFWL